MFFYVLKYYGTVIFACSLVILLLGAAFSIKKGKKFRAWLRALGKGKILNLVIIAVFALSCVISVLAGAMSGRAKVSLIYEGASVGENPDGTRFYRGSFISDTVLSRAAEEGNLGVSAMEISKTLSVRPVKVGGGRAETGEFISCEYIIEYEASAETAGVGKKKMLSLVTDSYLREFASEYNINDEELKDSVVITIYGIKNELPGMTVRVLAMTVLFSLGLYTLNFASDNAAETKEEPDYVQ